MRQGHLLVALSFSFFHTACAGVAAVAPAGVGLIVVRTAPHSIAIQPILTNKAAAETAPSSIETTKSRHIGFSWKPMERLLPQEPQERLTQSFLL
eukprot:3687274-Amphidinium_carterae.1